MTRHKAALIHLAICCVIALGLWCAMRWIWYHSVFFQALGGAGLVLILVGVDVVIGPLLTFVIYKPGKKGLKFDLAFIGALQLAALVYGAHVVYLARPVYLVFSVDRFEMVSAADIDAADLASARYPEFKQLPMAGPKVIAATLPTEKSEIEAVLFSSLQAGKDVSQMPKFYVPFSDKVTEAIARAKKFDELGTRKQKILESLKDAGVSASALDALGYLPIRGKRENAIAVIDRNNGQIVEMFPVDPWS